MRGRRPTIAEAVYLPGRFREHWQAVRRELTAHGLTVSCCATCSLDAQLLYMGTTRSRVDAFRAIRGFGPLESLERQQLELFLQWLLRHPDTFETPLPGGIFSHTGAPHG